MVMQKGRSGLASKLGARLQAGVQAHINDEVKFSNFGDLPGGISGGVAKLVECKITTIAEGKDHAGDYMFFARGVVVAPLTFTDPQGNVHHVQGKGTMISCPLYDTPERKSRQTVEDHIGWVMNEMRKLGGQDIIEAAGGDLERAAEILKGAGIYFKFRTWQGKPSKEYPEPRVNHDWEGGIEYTEEDPDPAAAVEDNTPAQPAKPAQPAARAAAKPHANGAKPPAALPSASSLRKPAAPPPPPPAEEFNEFAVPTPAELKALVAKAGKGDGPSEQRLMELAQTAGYSEQEALDATDWNAVAEMIRNPKPTNEDQQGDEPAAGDDAPAGPNDGDVVQYRPYDKRTKGQSKKPIEVEVISVDHDAGTALVKALANDTEYPDVPLTELILPDA